jgi:L-lactate dehydrogenase (cytochrome)
MSVAAPTEFRAAAKRRLPRFLFDYADGGAFAETTMRANKHDLADISLRQRVLRNVEAIDVTTSLFGRSQALPVVLGPIRISGMYRRRGEVQAARAANTAGVPFCLSTVSLCSLDEVRRAAPGPVWFQLYVIRDRAFMRDMLNSAKEQGAQALVFTVDMPVPGARYRDTHSGMSGPNSTIRRFWQGATHPSWAWDVGVRGRPHTLGNLAKVLGKDNSLNDYMGWLGRNFDPSVTWADLDWIRSAWDGPLIIKGILEPDDAREAASQGADGIVVSNHGGRQLDGVLSTARALPAIADAVGETISVLVDGGVRSGLDVVRMLALGADGVLLGRAWLYALAAQGETGVTKLLALIESEMRVTMALTGARSVAEINRSILCDPATFPVKEALIKSGLQVLA